MSEDLNRMRRIGALKNVFIKIYLMCMIYIIFAYNYKI